MLRDQHQTGGRVSFSVIRPKARVKPVAFGSEQKNETSFEAIPLMEGVAVVLSEILIRFLIGGAIVSFFAILGDLFKPKSFAGLFGAAPSVALATLSLAILKDGKHYASTEVRSMELGALAFLVYASLVARLLARHKTRALSVTASAILLWLAAAFGLWFAVLKS